MTREKCGFAVSPAKRIAALDGFTVASMLLVNNPGTWLQGLT
jgi:predicted acyltransferase